ncbi:hypothetical protein [Staphylococcus kloosii]|uniref:Uncharacterized protein n=1 Tax=Staphylococcus kloosii TaxID=29384 RepID=A0ABQ0XNR1_9STAP|nr:hypothetical protein [Staphylococcus kloosii]GEP82543.1 hypothetical protein SKL01_17210 [Staphylococcus kloosii]SUM48846.1 Uncharacterised protein [Staphylococcus kloosii]
MREQSKIIYRGWNKEIFILQGKNISDCTLVRIVSKFSELYTEYNIVVIPKEVEFEIK